MNLSQLYYFRTLASCQHYTRAAEKLFISQSALSHSMSSLEADLGCQLFRKSGRNVVLTDEGKVFQGYIDAALTQLDLGVAKLKEQHGAPSSRLRIGLAADDLADRLSLAVKAYNEANGVSLTYATTHDTPEALVDDLLEQRIDLALSYPLSNARISCTPFLTRRVVLLVPRRMLLAARPSIALPELKGSRLYTFAPATPMGKAIAMFLAAQGTDTKALHIHADSKDEASLCSLLVERSALGLAFDTAVVAHDPNLEMLRVDAPGADDALSICALIRKGNTEDPQTREFAHFLASFMPRKAEAA